MLPLLLLLSCSLVCSQELINCTQEDICVASDHEKDLECPPTFSRIIRSLSDVTLNCTFVHVYMTSGTHRLNENLALTNLFETLITGHNSIIKCSVNTVIAFTGRKKGSVVNLKNLVFTQCQLHLKYVSSSLDNIIIKNSASYGLYSKMARNHQVTNCKFENNSFGHILIYYWTKNYSGNCIVNVSNTVLNGSAYNYSVSVYPIYNPFAWSNVTVILRNSSLCNGSGGLSVQGVKQLDITDSIVKNNTKYGIYIKMFPDQYNVTPIGARVVRCLIENSGDIGVKFERKPGNAFVHMQTEIRNVIFAGNSRALHMSFYSWNNDNPNLLTIFSNCSFHNHKTSDSLPFLEKSIMTLRSDTVVLTSSAVIMENCSFRNNAGVTSCHSALRIDRLAGVTLNNVDISDNECTGISLLSSTIEIKNHLNITRNAAWLGGAFALNTSYVIHRNYLSEVFLTESSLVYLANNTAETYGGGLFSDVTCEKRVSTNCFFHLVEVPIAPVLIFSGNRARLGGDEILGGCLMNCSIQMNNTWIKLNSTDKTSIFHDIISSDHLTSQSTIVEYPVGAMFCTNTTSSSLTAVCSDSRSVSVFRGQPFTVPVMAGDSSCYPTHRVVKAKVGKKFSLLRERDVIETQKFCQNLHYAIGGPVSLNETIVEFSFQNPLAPYNRPAVLKIFLKECPPGLYWDSSKEQCKCHEAFLSYKIQCSSDTYVLLIPAQTWVGIFKNRLIVHDECQLCKTVAVEQDIGNITSELCTADRSGTLCGKCTKGYSLKLGGYECGKCSNSPLVGTVLVLVFTLVGVVLVFVLLRLDLTISTGAINGMIFYSNIVYLNSDVFLPVSMESESSHLHSFVTVLYTFQAWMNLDFGIVTCFFNGYNAYISTWMQFVYPLYIWILIITIVISSWYSTTIAKLTTSNTVPVLATLLLLSYAKLLKTTIECFSSVQLSSLDGEAIEIVWKLDGNVPYLGKLHMPLFVMSLLMVMGYILPFTLLVLLGPILQAKSRYKFFRWIHKIKPFLDAFYGCHTVKYRHWPGILLLTRVAIIGLFAAYATDTPLKLLIISIMVLLLFIVWLAIGKTDTVSFYQQQRFNYLELFFLSNLGAISVVSLYIQFNSQEKILKHQQLLASVMVGSAFIVSFGVIICQASSLLLKFTTFQNFNTFMKMKLKQLIRVKPKTPTRVKRLHTVTAERQITSTEIKIPADQLREPLLTNETFAEFSESDTESDLN